MVDKTTVVEGVPELGTYFESVYYAVGDSYTHDSIEANTLVEHDMNLTVMKRNVIDIDLEPGVDSVNVTDVASTVSAITGIPVDEIIVEVQVDDKGEILRVVVTISDAHSAQVLVDAVNNVDKDHCASEFLCRSKQARINTDYAWLSTGNRHNMLLPTIIMLFASFLITIII